MISERLLTDLVGQGSSECFVQRWVCSVFLSVCVGCVFVLCLGMVSIGEFMTRMKAAVADTHVPNPYNKPDNNHNHDIDKNGHAPAVDVAVTVAIVDDGAHGDAEEVSPRSKRELRRLESEDYLHLSAPKPV